MKKELDGLVNKVKKHLSAPVMEQLEQLKSTLEILIEKLDGFDQASYQLHSVRQTILKYLPDLLESYLKLPTAYARFHHLKNGKTPRDILIDQLTVLNTEMLAMIELAVQNDTKELLVQSEFINEKFGQKEDWLN